MTVMVYNEILRKTELGRPTMDSAVCPSKNWKMKGTPRDRIAPYCGLAVLAVVWLAEHYRNATLWRGGLVVGRRTCDLVVAGSRPGRDVAA